MHVKADGSNAFNGTHLKLDYRDSRRDCEQITYAVYNLSLKEKASETASHLEQVMSCAVIYMHIPLLSDIPEYIMDKLLGISMTK